MIDIDELPAGWGLASLGQLVQPSKTKIDPALVPDAAYVGLEHIEPHTRRIIGQGRGKDVKSSKAVFQAGDVLYGKLRPYLNKVAIPSFDGIASTDVLVFPESSHVTAQFLARLLNSAAFVDLAHQSSAGMELPRTSWKSLRDIQVPVPPIDEQRRIIERLDEIDTYREGAIAHLEKSRGILDGVHRAVIAAACSGSLTEDWRRDNTGGSDGEAPFGWEIVQLHEIVECLDRFRKPVNSAERAARAGSVPYYGANGRVGWIDDALFDETLVLVVEDETFTGRTRPFSYIVSGPAWVNNHAHVLRASPRVSPEALNILLSYYDFIPLTSGSTGRRKLTQKALMAAEISLPPLVEQREIVRRVEQMIASSLMVGAKVDVARRLLARTGQAALATALRGELFDGGDDRSGSDS
ncbi:restriction endonuclease subunit S [Streptomyces rochei]|uniref:restriction endonuclease subunit S n=1 Tax=Streptomyces rochei TaxID=1928 RepID=UPI00382F0F89